MPKKFDTNPLDPDFPEKAKAETAPVAGFTAPNSPFKTAEFPTEPGSITEDETQKFNDAHFGAYAFHGGPAAVYQPPVMAEMNRASDRKVAKFGIPERWALAAPYLPIWLGFVAGVVLLLLMPKEESKVRFHAAQGLAAYLGILIVTTILGIIENVTDLAELGSLIFTVATTIMMIVFAVRAFKGKPVHIEAVDDLTNWLEDKIGPVRSS